jgi:hypothetical protein
MEPRSIGGVNSSHKLVLHCPLLVITMFPREYVGISNYRHQGDKRLGPVDKTRPGESVERGFVSSPSRKPRELGRSGPPKGLLA